MTTESVDTLPILLKVDSLIESRYSNNERPLSWDNRKSGVDVILTPDGKKLKLQSDGGQSPPKRGWSLLLTNGDPKNGYAWTLYSMPKSSADKIN